LISRFGCDIFNLPKYRSHRRSIRWRPARPCFLPTAAEEGLKSLQQALTLVRLTVRPAQPFSRSAGLLRPFTASEFGNGKQQPPVDGPPIFSCRGIVVPRVQALF
jgi:hypothetical protein